MLRITAILALGLSGCFQAVTSSSGNVKKIAASDTKSTLSSTSGKSVASVALSKEPITLSADNSNATSGTSITINPGTLSVATSLVIENASSLSDTSVVQELSLASDIKIESAGEGVIIRPTENVSLNAPLLISLPVPTSASLRLSSAIYAIAYKSYDPVTQKLMTGLIPIDGINAKFTFNDKTQQDLIAFEGYFGSYWIIRLNRELTASETPKPKVSEEPIVNKSGASVIAKDGIIAETTVTNVQALAPLVLSKTELSFDESTRLMSAKTSGENLENCVLDTATAPVEFGFKTIDIGKNASYSATNFDSKSSNVSARFRCRDKQGRTAKSEWSHVITIPPYLVANLLSISSPLNNGSYRSGTIVPIELNYNQAVTLTGNPILKIQLNSQTRIAQYTGGSGTSKLRFEYTIAAGDNASKLDTTGIDAFSLEGGTLVDAKEIAVSTLLPAPGSSSSLGGQKAIEIDTLSPLAPAAVSFSSNTSNSRTVALSWTGSTDSSLLRLRGKLCDTNSCAGSCETEVILPLAGGSIVSGQDQTYFGCLQSEDRAGNLSPYTASSASISVDTVSPSLVSVSSPSTQGFFTTAQTILIDLNFSEPISVVNASNIRLLLETGSTDREATYDSQISPTSLRFRYVIQSGDSANPLDTVTSNAFISGGGTIKDLAGNVFSGSLPNPGSSGSLSNAFNFRVDTEAPSFGGIKVVYQENSSSIRLRWNPAVDAITPSSSIVYELCYTQTAGSCVSSFTPMVTVGPNKWDHLLTGLTAGAQYEFVMVAKDILGNRSVPNIIRTNKEHLGMVSIVNGDRHSCALMSDSSVKCWGGGESGQLGNGTPITIATPKFVTGLSGVTALTAGVNYTCALLSDKTIKCWGQNNYGQLGLGHSNQTNVPTTVVGINNAVSVKAGESHTCALHDDGTMSCWGRNLYGQLGNNSTTNSLSPVVVGGLPSLAKIEVTPNTSCAISNSMDLFCWGYGGNGQLGHNAMTNLLQPGAAILSNVAIAAPALEHSCAMLSDGTVYCWGKNNVGQLGQGSTSAEQLVPTLVPTASVSGATQLASSKHTTCALFPNGTIKCWGENSLAALGNGTLASSATPTLVSGISTATKVSGGPSQHLCAVLSNGSARCWGHNNYTQMGDGSMLALAMPTTVEGLSGVSRIFSGLKHACAVLAGGSVKCWGDNANTVLGNGTNIASSIPVDVSGLTSVSSLALGETHSCALLTDTSVKCWGNNSNGALGTGNFTSSATAVSAGGLTDVTMLSSGLNHMCALINDGSIKCWGYNANGQLGNGLTTSSNTPVLISSISGATAIASGNHHTCALLTAGDVKCWGYNNAGQLGDNTLNQALTPVSVMGLSGMTKIMAGANRSCAADSSGNVKCWGANGSGEFGIGNGTNYKVPTSTGFTGASELNLGEATICGLFSGEVRCAGNNSQGYFGNGLTTNSNVLVSNPGLKNVTSLGGGYNFQCARLSDQTARCWGRNEAFQLGTPSYILRQTIAKPVLTE